MTSFKLFIKLNITIWWRSVRKAELAGIIFYGIFLLLIFSQFVQVALLLLTAENTQAVQQVYPWFDENSWVLFHVILINLVWFMQFGFTKTSRLQLSENKKLVALGFPMTKVIQYINLTGFLHPLNLMFHLFWLIYFGSMVHTLPELLLVILFVTVSYALFITVKWKFHQLLDKLSAVFKWGGIILLFIAAVVVLYGEQIYTLNEPLAVIEQLLSVFVYTPGMLFYNLFSGVSAAMLAAAILIMILMAVLLFFELSRQTRYALVTPLATGRPDSSRAILKYFISIFGHEGGKSQYYIWSHPYVQSQAAFAVIFPVFYLIVVADAQMTGINYIVPMFFTMVPVIIFVIMLSNIFGFENKELLISVQFPQDIGRILAVKFKAALLTGFALSAAGVAGILYFFSSPVHIFQIVMGMAFVCLIFVNYLIKQSVYNYKKIESVSAFSLSNPVISQSVSFVSIIGIIVLSALVFPVYESVQWIHIGLIIAANVYISICIMRNLQKLSSLFKKRLISALWNEL